MAPRSWRCWLARLPCLSAPRSPLGQGRGRNSDMAFQLKRKEAISHGIKRNVRRRIEKALAHLRAGGDPDETVYEVRKSFKRVRAALRLARDNLGDTVYRRENFFFRDAARPLTAARDAVVLVETLDNLTKHSADQIKPGEFREVRTLLAANRKADRKSTRLNSSHLVISYA